MEHQVEFDLNTAIREWRQRLSQSPAFRQENLDELESHLRDAMTDLQSEGLSAEEGFLIASRRTGNPSALATEYTKVHRKELWMERLFWMVFGVLGWTLVTLLSRAVTDGTVIGSLSVSGYKLKSTMSESLMSGNWLVVLLQVAAQALGMVVLAAAGGWLITNTRISAAICRSLRHPLALSLAVMPCLLLLAVHALGLLRAIFMARLLSMEELRVIDASSTVSNFFVKVAFTILLSTALIWLARRRVRLHGTG